MLKILNEKACRIHNITLSHHLLTLSIIHKGLELLWILPKFWAAVLFKVACHCVDEVHDLRENSPVVVSLLRLF